MTAKSKFKIPVRLTERRQYCRSLLLCDDCRLLELPGHQVKSSLPLQNAAAGVSFREAETGRFSVFWAVSW